MDTAAVNSVRGLDKNPEVVTARRKVAPVIFTHIVLKTNRYQGMLDWYMTVLDAVPVLEQDKLCFMTYDEEHHRIAIAEIPMLLTVPRFFTGTDHMAYTYTSISDLVFTHKRL